MKLVHGHGDNPGKGCIMDFAVWRLTEGQVWADRHPCFNAAITSAAQQVNDGLTKEGLARLDRDFSDRVDRCRAARDSHVERRIVRRLALWCARDVEHLSSDPRVRACNDVTERWLAGDATNDELRKARRAAYATAYAAYATADAAYAATAATAAAHADDADAHADAHAAAAAYAAADATHAAYAATAAAKDRALLDFLDRLLDQWEKIAADAGALGDLWTWQDYCQANGA